MRVNGRVQQKTVVSVDSGEDRNVSRSTPLAEGARRGLPMGAPLIRQETTAVERSSREIRGRCVGGYNPNRDLDIWGATKTKRLVGLMQQFAIATGTAGDGGDTAQVKCSRQVSHYVANRKRTAIPGPSSNCDGRHWKCSSGLEDRDAQDHRAFVGTQVGAAYP